MGAIGSCCMGDSSGIRTRLENESDDSSDYGTDPLSKEPDLSQPEEQSNITVGGSSTVRNSKGTYMEHSDLQHPALFTHLKSTLRSPSDANDNQHFTDDSDDTKIKEQSKCIDGVCKI